MAKRKASQADGNGSAAHLGFEAKMWLAADKLRSNMDAAEYTNEGVVFFALEVELWRIGNSPLAPKFNIVSSPNDWSRTVAEARKEIEQGALSESSQRYLAFWKFFADQLQSRNCPLRVPKPNGDYWKNFSLGRSNFLVTAMVLARDEWIGVQLALYGERSKPRFKLLEDRKSEIEAALGTALEWRELPNHKESQIRLRRTGIDPKQPETWQEICDWLILWTEKFQNYFRTIVKDLDLDESTSADAP